MSKQFKILGLMGVALCWILFSHFFSAFDQAKLEAHNSAFSGALISFKKNTGTGAGYIPYCEGTKNKTILTYINNKEAEVNRGYRKKQAGAVGLALFGALLNQSFGDKNYSNYKKKYGTNPYNALTGGALNKAPGIIGNIAASDKKKAMKKINNLHAQLKQQAKKLCYCQFIQAFDDTHGSWTVLSATFGFVRPSSINKAPFFQRADLNAKICS